MVGKINRNAILILVISTLFLTGILVAVSFSKEEIHTTSPPDVPLEINRLSIVIGCFAISFAIVLAGAGLFVLLKRVRLCNRSPPARR